MAPKRIAYCRIAQESNGLSPVLSTLDDFTRAHFKRGEELGRACQKGQWEAEGFLKAAELTGVAQALDEAGDAVEAVPLFSGWAVPGGPITAETVAWFERELVEALEAAGPLDGLCMVLHGAMVADGVDDPEAVWLEAARRVLGPDVPLAVTMDLHALLTPRKLAPIDILSAYRTNPHRDFRRVGHRCGRILVDAVLGRVKPKMAWRTLPLVRGGGTTMDFLSPMRQLFQLMKKMERDSRVQYVSLFMSHLWLDHSELGWATCVVTDDDQALAEQLAEQLADAVWEARHPQPPELPSASEAISQARGARWARRVGTVCMSDASDMVGAGGTGENTHLLRALIEEGQGLLAYVPLRDPVAVEELFARRGPGPYTVVVGGRLDPDHNPPLTVTGTVLRREETDNFGRVVVLRVGDVRLVLTSGAALVMQPRFYSDLGLSPWKADICVVKSLFPFRLWFLAMNRKTIYAKTRGVTDFDKPLEFEFTDPVFPKEPVEDWRFTDRRRRGVA